MKYAILLIALALAGCKVPRETTGPDRHQAMKTYMDSCEPHGGVAEFKENYGSNSDYFPRMVCKDSTVLDFHWSKTE